MQKEIITTEYLVGLEQYKAGQYDAAVATLSEFLGKYPLDNRDPGILFLFGQIAHQKKQFEAAIADWRKLVAKYPGTSEAACARLRIARTLEEDWASWKKHWKRIARRPARPTPQATPPTRPPPPAAPTGRGWADSWMSLSTPPAPRPTP